MSERAPPSVSARRSSSSAERGAAAAQAAAPAPGPTAGAVEAAGAAQTKANEVATGSDGRIPAPGASQAGGTAMDTTEDGVAALLLPSIGDELPSKSAADQVAPAMAAPATAAAASEPVAATAPTAQEPVGSMDNDMDDSDALSDLTSLGSTDDDEELARAPTPGGEETAEISAREEETAIAAPWGQVIGKTRSGREVKKPDQIRPGDWISEETMAKEEKKRAQKASAAARATGASRGGSSGVKRIRVKAPKPDDDSASTLERTASQYKDDDFEEEEASEDEDERGAEDDYDDDDDEEDDFKPPSRPSSASKQAISKRPHVASGRHHRGSPPPTTGSQAKAGVSHATPASGQAGKRPTIPKKAPKKKVTTVLGRPNDKGTKIGPGTPAAAQVDPVGPSKGPQKPIVKQMSQLTSRLKGPSGPSDLAVEDGSSASASQRIKSTVDGRSEDLNLASVSSAARPEKKQKKAQGPYTESAEATKDAKTYSLIQIKLAALLKDGTSDEDDKIRKYRKFGRYFWGRVDQTEPELLEEANVDVSALRRSRAGESSAATGPRSGDNAAAEASGSASMSAQQRPKGNKMKLDDSEDEAENGAKAGTAVEVPSDDRKAGPGRSKSSDGMAARTSAKDHRAGQGGGGLPSFTMSQKRPGMSAAGTTGTAGKTGSLSTGTQGGSAVSSASASTAGAAGGNTAGSGGAAGSSMALWDSLYGLTTATPKKTAAPSSTGKPDSARKTTMTKLKGPTTSATGSSAGSGDAVMTSLLDPREAERVVESGEDVTDEQMAERKARAMAKYDDDSNAINILGYDEDVILLEEEMHRWNNLGVFGDSRHFSWLGAFFVRESALNEDEFAEVMDPKLSKKEALARAREIREARRASKPASATTESGLGPGNERELHGRAGSGNGVHVGEGGARPPHP